MRVDVSIYSYSFMLISPLLAGVGLMLGGWWSWLHPVVMYGLITLLELWWRGTPNNLSQEGERARAEHWFARGMLWVTVPVVFALILTLLLRAESFRAWELVGLIIGVGTTVGALGINAAHELGHDRGGGAKRLAESLLLMSLFMHFHVEHNRGHHARVATPDDPASAPRGQWLYAFWCQTLWGGLRSAWGLEAGRLARQERSAWSFHNSVVCYGLLQAGAVVVVGLTLGAGALFAWLLVALFGILILETTNYFQHYGLVRKTAEDGSVERVGPQHSWTANHPISRILLLDLPRHADHHMAPGRHFSNLRHLPESPVLPMGYTGMVMLALVPPLFINVMDKQLAAFGDAKA